MQRKRPTLEDVARAAGVSRSTVSRVVNDDAAVAPSVRRRVWRVIDELDYRPHGTARALASGRSDAVELVVLEDGAEAFSANPFYGRVVAGVLDALADADAHMRVHVVRTADAAAALPEIARTAGPGALLVNVPGALAEMFYRRCGRTVSLGHWAPHVPSIDAENAAGTDAVVRHLYGVGRRRIAAIDGPENNPCAIGRREGYQSAMRDAGLPAVAACGDFTRARGVAATRRLLEAAPDIDAVFAACDLTAVGALQALAEAGRRVPDDVAVAGYDGSVLAACATPPLTSVYQPVESIAATATAAVLRRNVPSGWRRVLPTTLTVRESSVA